MNLETISTHLFCAMGCPCRLVLAGAADISLDLRATLIAEAERLEMAYSRFREESIVSDIARVALRGASYRADPETAKLIDEAYRAYRLSGGLFDITTGALTRLWHAGRESWPNESELQTTLEHVGLHRVRWDGGILQFQAPNMSFDLGGIVKEYAVDQLLRMCREAGLRGAIVDLGGDVATFGTQPDGAPWRIGIQDPFASDNVVATLFLMDAALATSGHRKRFSLLGGRHLSHIINPLTGFPLESDVGSLSVLDETCLAAGLHATIALLKGPDGVKWLHSQSKPYLLIDRDQRLLGPIADVLRRSADCS